MIRKLLVVVVLVGCGGSDGMMAVDPPPAAPLVGNWISTISSTCAAAFDATTTTFAFAVICANGGPVELQEQTGTYTLTGSSLVLTNAQATCAGTPKTDLETVTVDATSLVMTDSAGVIAYTRNTAAAGGAATYGCFSNGVFTASPLAPL